MLILSFLCFPGPVHPQVCFRQVTSDSTLTVLNTEGLPISQGFIRARKDLGHACKI